MAVSWARLHGTIQLIATLISPGSAMRQTNSPTRYDKSPSCHTQRMIAEICTPMLHFLRNLQSQHATLPELHDHGDRRP